MSNNKVAEERKHLKLTQTAFAKEIKISRTALWKIENGTVPKAETMKKIADYCGRTVDYIFFNNSVV